MSAQKDRPLPWSASGVVDELRARRDEMRRHGASPSGVGAAQAYEEAAQLIETCSDPRAFGPVLEELRGLHATARKLSEHLANGDGDISVWTAQLGMQASLVALASAAVDAALDARSTLPERVEARSGEGARCVVGPHAGVVEGCGDFDLDQVGGYVVNHSHRAAARTCV